MTVPPSSTVAEEPVLEGTVPIARCIVIRRNLRRRNHGLGTQTVISGSWGTFTRKPHCTSIEPDRGQGSSV
jgi:hypothetical protein